ncbi:molybdopterin-synthase adenylyltransferase MoeB [Maribacter sp. 2307ULW6-5]|uniref:molybdopterin-synthase adenylyltransferase MoeB n=1 Tax=Maribacter sp. 2307ULW6-5 TaxID=3386275 RepID=UPI0039BD1CE2
MTDQRYHRQLILKGFGPEGQQKLARARVLVVGAGGLGVPVLTYLNAMGVGTLGIVDADVVQASNLHRQVLYEADQVGQSKVRAAKARLGAQNPHTQIEAHPVQFTVHNAMELLAGYDLVVDATDNFPTRYLINDACVLRRIPFVYGALHAFQGQVSVFNYKGGPTYRCLFPEMPGPDTVPDCNTHGVLGILPGIIGNLQALEAIKVITGLGQVLSGILLLYDALAQQTRQMRFSKNPENVRIAELRPSYTFSCAAPVPSVTAKMLGELLKEGQPFVLDVRTEAEFRVGHIAGAKNIPLPRLKDGMHQLEGAREVYVICQSGARSLRAVQQLSEAMPSTVFFQVEGGMNQYQPHDASH